MRSALLLLSFVASALAYAVTAPSQTKGWTNSGAQTLSWTRVNTDPLNFTALLTNQDRSVMPNNNQVLAALVDGTTGSISLNPPSGGWIVGAGFQVNLVKDETDFSTIYAQSNQFNITTGSTSSTSSTTTTTKGGNTVTAAATSATGTSTDTSTGALNPTTTPNAALPAVGVNPVFVGAVALLGAVFA